MDAEEMDARPRMVTPCSTEPAAQPTAQPIFVQAEQWRCAVEYAHCILERVRDLVAEDELCGAMEGVSVAP